MDEDPGRALSAYRAVNVDGTLGVIQAMVAAGVRRMVYVSSIKACAESGSGLLAPNSQPAPSGPYGLSKFEAEQLVLDHGRRGLIDPIIIRPPLVHGPGAKGNLRSLMEAILKGRLLPFGAIANRRSLIGLDNLCDALITAATVPWEQLVRARAEKKDDSLPVENRRSQGCIYHVADDGVISTHRLVEVLAEGLGVKPRLLSVPRWLAVGGATLLGKGAVARRLFDDLEVDDSDFRRDLGWKPRIGLEDGLRLMAEDFARRKRDE